MLIIIFFILLASYYVSSVIIFFYSTKLFVVVQNNVKLILNSALDFAHLILLTYENCFPGIIHLIRFDSFVRARFSCRYKALTASRAYEVPPWIRGRKWHPYSRMKYRSRCASYNNLAPQSNEIRSEVKRRHWKDHSIVLAYRS